MKTLMSIWLVPQNEDKKYLQEIVNKLADENNSPKFTPHLTLFAGIEIEVDKLKNAVDEVFKEIKPFKIKKTNISQSELFFKTVFVEFELDENLKNLFNSFSKKTDNRSIDDFKPHISLMYKTMTKNEKLEIIKSLSIKNDFVIGSVIITAPGLNQKDFSDVSSWRNLYEVKLNY
jgi:2'-5' RNA ligase